MFPDETVQRHTNVRDRVGGVLISLCDQRERGVDGEEVIAGERGCRGDGRGHGWQDGYRWVVNDEFNLSESPGTYPVELQRPNVATRNVLRRSRGIIRAERTSASLYGIGGTKRKLISLKVIRCEVNRGETFHLR